MCARVNQRAPEYTRRTVYAPDRNHATLNVPRQPYALLNEPTRNRLNQVTPMRAQVKLD